MYRKLLMAAVACLALLAATGGADAAKAGESCGGIAGIPCDEGLWCQWGAGTCHVADGGGTCVKAPEICNQRFLPVCGCDGKTYGNDCERQVHKVSKAHDGSCT
jgi:hypothetical protein